MEINVIKSELENIPTQTIVIGVSRGALTPLSNTAARVDEALQGELKAILEAGDFQGKKNETLVLYTHGRLPTRRVILVGLGKPESLTPEVIREAAATVARRARDLGLDAFCMELLGQSVEGISPTETTEATVEGVVLGLYRFTELKTETHDSQPAPSHMTFIAPDWASVSELQAAAERGYMIASSVMVTRDLVNRPANIATPGHIASVAQAIAADTGLSCQILEKPELEALGFNLFLSVNQGGRDPARLVILEHNAGRDDLPTIVLVGKGITFDTGGISLKSSQNMDRMKGDMAGAAAVIGALQGAAKLNLPLHIVGLTPLTDNMPDAMATKPGDVIRSLKGLTVEIVNTDAEGRLILADALTYAEKFHPTAIFDIATLTGGRIVALGDHAAAVMGDERLIEHLRRSGEAVGERVWPLPLFEAYGEQLKSDVADLKNVGGRAASTITAGYFLSKFVPEDVAWVHIDIAGLALAEKDSPYTPKGGTGFGVRLILQALRTWIT